MGVRERETAHHQTRPPDNMHAATWVYDNTMYYALKLRKSKPKASLPSLPCSGADDLRTCPVEWWRARLSLFEFGQQ